MFSNYLPCDFRKLCKLSEPNIPHLENGMNNSIYLMRMKGDHVCQAFITLSVVMTADRSLVTTKMSCSGIAFAVIFISPNFPTRKLISSSFYSH